MISRSREWNPNRPPEGSCARSLTLSKSFLVPLIRGQSVAPMLFLGDAVAQSCRTPGVVLSLVEIPARWTPAVPVAVSRSRELLRWIAANDYESQLDTGRLRIQSRFTSDPALSIREAILDAHCDLVLAEWPAPGARREHSLHSILRTLVHEAQPGLVVARPDPYVQAVGFRPANVLVALRGGANAWLALSVGMALATHTSAPLTLLHVYDLGHHRQHRRHEEAEFNELVEAAAELQPRVLELSARDPFAAVLAEAHRFDAIVMGAHRGAGRDGVLFGPALAGTMQELSRTVIVARAGHSQRDAA